MQLAPLHLGAGRLLAVNPGAVCRFQLLKLRVEVFVVEQATPYPELDGRDLLAETRHFWLENPDGGVIATLRLMVNALHARGMKVILDIVTNHMGQIFYYDINENGVPDVNPAVRGSPDQLIGARTFASSVRRSELDMPISSP